jgi:dephospho-CoA kinase
LIFGRIQAELEGFSALTVVEVPLLDSPLALPRMVVDADVETRLRRATGRGASREDVERRMASQPDREAWLAAADVVVPNHGTIEDLAGTVSRLANWLTDAK